MHFFGAQCLDLTSTVSREALCRRLSSGSPPHMQGAGSLGGGGLLGGATGPDGTGGRGCLRPEGQCQPTQPPPRGLWRDWGCSRTKPSCSRFVALCLSGQDSDLCCFIGEFPFLKTQRSRQARAPGATSTRVSRRRRGWAAAGARSSFRRVRGFCLLVYKHRIPGSWETDSVETRHSIRFWRNNEPHVSRRQAGRPWMRALREALRLRDCAGYFYI